MKPLREFFSEVTDIDNRLLKTFIHLFRKPTEVIEAGIQGQGTYTKPLRYLLFTSTLFIIWRFLYDNYVEGLFIDDYEVDDFWLPRRIAKANGLFNYLFDTIFPFQILLFLVPVAAVMLKGFFFRKSWAEAGHIALYSFGQLWVVLLLFVPLLVTANDAQLLCIMAAFTTVGFFFRKVLSKNNWVALPKWMAVGFLLTIWFYQVSLPVTQWGLAKIALPDRYREESQPAKPTAEITLHVAQTKISAVVPILRDPFNRFFATEEKSGGLVIHCIQPDSTRLWQTLLPNVELIREAISVRLPSAAHGFLVLVDEQIAPKISHAILLSPTGKILYTKTYREEMVLNGGDLVNDRLVLTGGKSNSEGIAPFVDVVPLNPNAEDTQFESATVRTYFLNGLGHRFDDAFALGGSASGITLLVAKYERPNPKHRIRV